MYSYVHILGIPVQDPSIEPSCTTQLVVDEFEDVGDTVSCVCPTAKSDEPEPAGLWVRPETKSDEAESGSRVCPEDKSDKLGCPCWVCPGTKANAPEKSYVFSNHLL